jgi:hypothetical protein
VRTDIYITRTQMIIAALAAIVVVLAIILLWPAATPTTTNPDQSGTNTTTKYIPPITNTPSAANQVAKNEAVFADERVAMDVLSLMGSHDVLSNALVQRAIAATTDVTGMTATYAKGTVILRDQVSINGQTNEACVQFTAQSLSGGPSVIACPQP